MLVLFSVLIILSGTGLAPFVYTCSEIHQEHRGPPDVAPPVAEQTGFGAPDHGRGPFNTLLLFVAVNLALAAAYAWHDHRREANPLLASRPKDWLAVAFPGWSHADLKATLDEHHMGGFSYDDLRHVQENVHAEPCEWARCNRGCAERDGGHARDRDEKFGSVIKATADYTDLTDILEPCLGFFISARAGHKRMFKG